MEEAWRGIREGVKSGKKKGREERGGESGKERPRLTLKVRRGLMSNCVAPEGPPGRVLLDRKVHCSGDPRPHSDFQTNGVVRAQTHPLLLLPPACACLHPLLAPSNLPSCPRLNPLTFSISSPSTGSFIQFHGFLYHLEFKSPGKPSLLNMSDQMSTRTSDSGQD